MHGLLYPAVYAVFVWWFSTGIVLMLDNLPRRTFRWSMTAGTILFALALHRTWATAWDTSEAAAYAAFTYAIIAWAWQEMSFFMGFVTGPRRVAATPGATLGERFRQGVAACLWHELAIIATAGVILASTWGAPNQVGTWTFMLLWLMRTSAKLNVFLGVLNLGEEFIPAHLRYLLSFMARRPMNALMPLSLAAGTAGTALLCQAAIDAGTIADAAGLTFLAAMLGLAVIEHWFLILPLPFARLWAWSLRFKPGNGKGPVTPARRKTNNPSRGATHGLPAILP
jgi:putative photosynthetic complex assembly protein 2